MRLIGLRTAAIQFNKSERTLRRWIREGMRHRRDSRRRIWLEHWVVISWVQYKTLVDKSKELPRAAAGYEITSWNGKELFGRGSARVGSCPHSRSLKQHLLQRLGFYQKTWEGDTVSALANHSCTCYEYNSVTAVPRLEGLGGGAARQLCGLFVYPGKADCEVAVWLAPAPVPRHGNNYAAVLCTTRNKTR